MVALLSAVDRNVKKPCRYLNTAARNKRHNAAHKTPLVFDLPIHANTFGLPLGISPGYFELG